MDGIITYCEVINVNAMSKSCNIDLIWNGVIQMSYDVLWMLHIVELFRHLNRKPESIRTRNIAVYSLCPVAILKIQDVRQHILRES